MLTLSSQDTGCLPPCEYSEYKLVEKIEGFVAHYGMGLAYATTEVICHIMHNVKLMVWVQVTLTFFSGDG